MHACGLHSREPSSACLVENEDGRIHYFKSPTSSCQHRTGPRQGQVRAKTAKTGPRQGQDRAKTGPDRARTGPGQGQDRARTGPGQGQDNQSWYFKVCHKKI